MSSVIEAIEAREILDSRGNPTLAASVRLADGTVAQASVPSGASTGAREALELRDGDRRRYLGRGVLQAAANVEQRIAPLLRGQDAADQGAIDRRMIAEDGTDNKSSLGANAMLAVSLAAARAAAAGGGVPLYDHLARLHGCAPGIMPLPMMNIVNGGCHADNGLDIQEFMVQPVGAPGFAEALRMGAEIFHSLKAALAERGLGTAVGDEGGFAPRLDCAEDALDIICKAVECAGYKMGGDVRLALDCAASEFYQDGGYRLGGRSMQSAELVDYLEQLAQNWPIASIEDGMAEDDWDGWAQLTARLGERVQLVGDDLFVTHTATLRRGMADGVANAILIKYNQIGTLTETLECIAAAQNAGYGTVISHRSGETEDTFIADLAVATAAAQIKTGSLSRSDRTAKYNRLLAIEQTLGPTATWPHQ